MAERICSIDDCDSPAAVRGWCRKHYTRWQRHGDPLTTRYRMDDRPTCSAEGCTREGRGSDGLCNTHYARANRARFRERDAAYRRRYRARPGQREREMDAAKRWKAANAERVAEYSYEYRKSHPDVVRAIKARRRALERGAAIRDLTAAEWQAIKAVYDHRCAYCGKRRPLTQDHVIPLSRGGNHTASNVVPACRPCNSRKNAGPAPEHQPLLF